MIPDLRVSLVALRDPGDDYENRAWCVAESVLALQWDVDRPWNITYPLRMDLDIYRREISFPPLAKLLDAWSQDSVGYCRITIAKFEQWLDVIQACVDWHGQERDEAMRNLHHSPDIAEQSFKLWMAVSLRLGENGEAGDTPIDLIPLLLASMTEVGLHCSDENDLLLTALLSLAGLRWEELNRQSGQPIDLDESDLNDRDFWCQCLERHLAGFPLKAQVRLRASKYPNRLCSPALRLVI